MREDNKGQNLIYYAAKNKNYALIEQLISMEVPCPADIKRKLDRNNNMNNKASIGKRSDEAVTEHKPATATEIKQDTLRTQDDIHPDAQAVLSTLTTFQQKEF